MKKNWKYYDLDDHLKKEHSGIGSLFSDIILGVQDGTVNVLGIVLALLAAANEIKIVLIGALAGGLAETVSMAAVAYTSAKAYKEYYFSQLKKEESELNREPKNEEKEVYEVYWRKGFRGKLLNDIVKHYTSSKKRMLNFMMKEELNLQEPANDAEIKKALIVGTSALIGSLIPVLPLLLPFFVLLTQFNKALFTIIFSATFLFLIGYYKAKITIGNPFKSGLQLAGIGIATAIIGYLIGLCLTSIL